MKNPITISIPQPCSENWSEMTPVQQGRFCQSCQKKVLDFTQLSDREIIKAFENNSSLCGRFDNSQLNRELIVPKEKSSIWMATTSAIISFLGIGTDDAVAQEKATTIQTTNKNQVQQSQANKIVTLSGIVVDENDIPLSGMPIRIDGKEIVHTRYDGTFSLQAPLGKWLLFSDDINYDITEHRITKEDKNLKIVCYTKTQVHRVTMGLVAYIPAENYTVPSKKRTFFGRIFHSIGNLFR